MNTTPPVTSHHNQEIIVDFEIPLRFFDRNINNNKLLSIIIEVDHGYYLYSACKQIIPEIKDYSTIGIHPIRGNYISNTAYLLLNPQFSVLKIRAPYSLKHLFQKLTNKVLTVGETILRTGNRIRTRTLIPSTKLYAKKVIISPRNFHNDFSKILPQAIEHRIRSLAPEANVVCKRMSSLRIHGCQICGYEVFVDQLTPQSSLLLQYNGVGQKRKFGCGIFVNA